MIIINWSRGPSPDPPTEGIRVPIVRRVAMDRLDANRAVGTLKRLSTRPLSADSSCPSSPGVELKEGRAGEDCSRDRTIKYRAVYTVRRKEMHCPLRPAAALPSFQLPGRHQASRARACKGPLDVSGARVAWQVGCDALLLLLLLLLLL